MGKIIKKKKKYLHKANSEVTKHTKKNCASNVI
jgi:hypothetical protein